MCTFSVQIYFTHSAQKTSTGLIYLYKSFNYSVRRTYISAKETKTKKMHNFVIFQAHAYVIPTY